MKTFMKALSVIALLGFATSAWAQSNTVSLGYKESGVSIEVNILTNYAASATLYCNGEAVFICDTGGVLYAASGVSWSANGSDFIVFSLPEGEYSGDMSVVGGGSYSAGSNSISWISAWGYYFALTSFS